MAWTSEQFIRTYPTKLFRRHATHFTVHSLQGSQIVGQLHDLPRPSRGGWHGLQFLWWSSSDAYFDICWYLCWVKCDCMMVYHHLPKWLLMQYGHVQIILRHRSSISSINIFQVDQTFQDFLLHIIHVPKQGLLLETPWQFVSGYISWFYRVSHSKVVSLVEG